MKPLDCRWTDVLSRHLLCTPTYPHYTAGSTFQGQSCFSLVILPVTVQKMGRLFFSNDGLLAGCRLELAEGFCFSELRFMLSALILQPTLVVDWPIKQTTSHLLIWAGQMSFHEIKFLSSLENWSSLTCRSGAFCNWCKSWSHFWNRSQMSMIDCSQSIIPKI